MSNPITITEISLSDPNEETHVVDFIYLCNGDVIRAWNGKPTFLVYARLSPINLLVGGPESDRIGH